MANSASFVTTLVWNILICCLLAVPALGETPLLANPLARSSLSLNGTWRVIPDPYETGLRGRYFLNRKPASKSALVEYDFDSAWPLEVPGDWNSEREDLRFYEGPVWYERSFLYHKRPDSRVFLYFGGANYAARVYLNGKELGEHEGGFTPFNFEATNTLVDGANFVVVEVNDTRRVEAVPSLDMDWWNFGGLTRDVALVEVPEKFIENYSLHLTKGSLTDLEGWVQVAGAAGERVNLDIPEAHIQQTAPTNSAGRALFHFSAKLELWSPENPRLYQVVFHAGKDSMTDEIGFRSVEARGSQILLNGKPLFLRGVNLHEQAPFRDGRAFSEEDERILLGWAKELGCNFVRLAHYPHNEHAIRLADKIGLLVWEEIPVYWGNAWENPATLENAEAQMREVIARDRNRAAVILWSLSNETPVSPARTSFLTQLASFTRAQDDTRLVTSAMLSRPQFAAHPENTAERGSVESIIFDDPLGEVLDVLGINEYVGWYVGKPEDADHLQWKIRWPKPVIISEFGAEALAGFHADAETRFSEEYQSRVYQHQLGMMPRVPALAGMTPWLLMDFRSPRRALAGLQDYHNRKGLLSDRGQKKQAFYLLQKFYRDLGTGTPAQQK